MYHFFRVFFVVLHFFLGWGLLIPNFFSELPAKTKIRISSLDLIYYYFLYLLFKGSSGGLWETFFSSTSSSSVWFVVFEILLKKTNASYFMHTSVKFTFFDICWSVGGKRCITLNTDIYLKFVVVIFFCMFHKYRQKSANKKEKHTILCVFQGFSKHEISS